MIFSIGIVLAVLGAVVYQCSLVLLDKEKALREFLGGKTPTSLGVGAGRLLIAFGCIAIMYSVCSLAWNWLP